VHDHSNCPLARVCEKMIGIVGDENTPTDEKVMLTVTKNLFCFLMQKDADVVLDVFGTMAVNHPHFFPIYLELVRMINEKAISCARRRGVINQEEAA